MRDNHNFTEPRLKQTWVNYEGNLAGPWLHWGASEKAHVITRSYRSDSTPTTPWYGRYVNSTEYDAFFSFIGGEPTTYYWKDAHKPWYVRVHKTSYPSGPGSWEPASNLHTYGCNSAYPHRPSVPLHIISQCEQAAVDKIYKDGYNFGQSLGELRESADLMAGLAIRLGQAIMGVYRGNPAQVARSLGVTRSRRFDQHVAEGLVWYKYGWEPLVADIYNLAKLIRNGIMPSMIGSVKVHKFDESFASQQPPLYNNYTGSAEGSFQRGVEVGFRVFLKNPALFDLDKYGLLDPLALAWELVPLSFVVDWFTGVGDFINGLTKPFGVAFLDGYRTTFLNNRYTLSFHENAENILAGDEPRLRVNQHSSYRKKYWDFPIPLPYFFIEVSSWSKLASILALTSLRS